jgi:hypothetical protein
MRRFRVQSRHRGCHRSVSMVGLERRVHDDDHMPAHTPRTMFHVENG